MPLKPKPSPRALKSPHLSHPPKAAEPPPPAQQQTELVRIMNILALAHHRNKNQHRRSRWWKELGMLRRGLRRIVEDGEALMGAQVEPKGVEKGKEKWLGKKGKKAGSKGVEVKEGNHIVEKEKRIIFIKERILPRCWVAFSGVVADNQYAVLGLMLLGALGRLGRVLGGVDFKEDEAEFEFVGLQGVGKGGEAGQEDVDLGGEDLGVPLQREEVTEKEAEGEERSATEKKRGRPEDEEAMVESPPLPTKTKRRKKHGDAIDDIFSGLT